AWSKDLKSEIQNRRGSTQRAGAGGSGNPVSVIQNLSLSPVGGFRNPKSAIANPKSDDSAQRAGAGGSSDQVTAIRCQMRAIGSRRPMPSFPLLLSAMGALLISFCAPVEAQMQKRIPRVGYLSALSRASETTRLALRDLGYIGGQNIALEYSYSDGKPDQAASLAAELVALKVDAIIVAGGDQWIRATRDATRTIPIIMAGGGLDPVEAGHVESLAHPGGNTTGLTILNTEVSRKRLELL